MTLFPKVGTTFQKGSKLLKVFSSHDKLGFVKRDIGGYKNKFSISKSRSKINSRDCRDTMGRGYQSQKINGGR